MTGKNSKNLNRRNFITGFSAATLTAVVNPFKASSAFAQSSSSKSQGFKLKYAPHFGMFKHHAGEDLIDQLKFMADEGFTAMEDNGMMGRDIAVQEKIARQMETTGMTMGVFVAYAEFRKTSFVHNKKEIKEMLQMQMTKAVETAKRVNAQWTTVVPGLYSTGMEWDYQTANVIDNLKRMRDLPRIYICGKPLYPRDAVEEWIRDNTTKGK